MSEDSGNGDGGAPEEAVKTLPPHWTPHKSGPRPMVECCEETIETVCRVIGIPFPDRQVTEG